MEGRARAWAAQRHTRQHKEKEQARHAGRGTCSSAAHAHAPHQRYRVKRRLCISRCLQTAPPHRRRMRFELVIAWSESDASVMRPAAAESAVVRGAGTRPHAPAFKQGVVRDTEATPIRKPVRHDRRRPCRRGMIWTAFEQEDASGQASSCEPLGHKVCCCTARCSAAANNSAIIAQLSEGGRTICGIGGYGSRLGG
jgi:hypothetical protein